MTPPDLPQVAAPPGPADAAAARFPVAAARAQAKVEALSLGRPNAAPIALLHAAQAARTARKRTMWLQRFVSAAVAPVGAASACRKGCAHCCHIGVYITDIEAQLIASGTGRAAAVPKVQFGSGAIAEATRNPGREASVRASMAAEAARHTGTACPFLRNGACEIYDLRPIACRTHFNLDDDALLCELHPGVEIHAPYLDATALRAVAYGAQGDFVLADIREFFLAQAPCATP